MNTHNLSRHEHRLVYRSVFSIIYAGLFFTEMLQLQGCSSGSIPTEATASLRYFADLNTPGSSRPELPAAVRFVTKVSALSDPRQTWLSITRSDSTTEEIYDDPTEPSSEKLSKLLASRVRFLPKDSTSHSLAFWQRVTDRCCRCQSPCAILEIGDCFAEGDGLEVHRQIRQLVHRLASSHLAFVGFVGAAPGSWESLRADFGELGPNRLRFFELSDAQSCVSLANRQGGAR